MSVTVTHAFTSAKADSSDATLIQPSNWNAAHTVVDNSLINVSTEFNFTAQSPGGSLTSGITNTVTLTPVPDGVNAADVNHYLYVYDGVGTAEVVLITGGTAVAGSASGTITFVPANNHSGAWKIKSATAGIQEAIVDATTGSAVYIPAGTHSVDHIHVNKLIKIYGSNIGTTLQPLTGAGTALLTVDPSSQTEGIEICHLCIDMTNANTLICMSVTNVKRGYFHHIKLNSGATGLSLNHATNSCVWSHFSDFRILDQTTNGVLIDGDVNAENWFDDFDIQITGATNMTYGFKITRTNANDTGAHYMNRVRVTRVGAGTMTNAFHFTSTTATQLIAKMVDCVGDNTNGGAVLYMNNVGVSKFTSSWFFGASASDYTIYMSGGSANYFINCTIGSNNRGCVQFASSPAELAFIGNRLVAHASYYGFYAAAGTPTNITIVGNVLALGSALLNGVALGSNTLRLEGNLGEPTSIPTVASGASIVFPDTDIFLISGNTGVGAVSGLWVGRTGKFMTTTGTVTFTSGATIGNTFTTTQLVPVDYFFDGTKLWMH